MDVSDRDFLSWFAGFWDGEGCFTIRCGKKNNYRFSACQAGERGYMVLNLIRDFFRVGKVCSFPSDALNRKPIHRWVVYSRSDILDIVERMLPFLQCRREEVINKLEILKTLGTSRSKYTKHEDEFICNNYKKMSDEQLGNELGRGKCSIVRQRHRMLLFRRQIPEDVTNFIKNNYKILTDRAIGKQLNFSPESIKQIRLKHGLKKRNRRVKDEKISNSNK